MSILKAGLITAAMTGLLATTVPSMAAPYGKVSQATTARSDLSDATDFSSQRRRVRRGPGPGAALAGAAAVGIIGSAIAAGAAREYYGPGPYYGPGYGYYGPQPYYGPGYYNRW